MCKSIVEAFAIKEFDVVVKEVAENEFVNVFVPVHTLFEARSVPAEPAAPVAPVAPFITV